MRFEGRPRIRWSRILLGGITACLLAVAPVLAGGSGGGSGDVSGDGSGNTGGAGSSGSNFASGGDETIGTLPAFGGAAIDLPLTRNWRGVRPAFTIEGTSADLSSVVLAARGRGFVSVEVLDLATQRLRVGFHGDVLVLLDRDLASQLPVDLGLGIPAAFGTGQAIARWEDGRSQRIPLGPGTLPLPAIPAADNETVPSAGYSIRTANAAGVRTRHTVRATPDLVVLEQDD